MYELVVQQFRLALEVHLEHLRLASEACEFNHVLIASVSRNVLLSIFVQDLFYFVNQSMSSSFDFLEEEQYQGSTSK